MLALTDLPLELLEHILRLAGDTEAEFHTREELYCTTALVARRWRAPSQRLLWEDVALVSDSQAALFADSEGTSRHVTRLLSFLVPLGVSMSSEVAAGAIESAHSLRFLDLNGLHTTENMAASVLESNSLCDLEALLLNRPLSAPKTSFNIPFRLKRLCIGDATYAEGLLTSISTASANTLTSFTIAIGESEAAAQVALTALELVSPQLQDLGIWWRGNNLEWLDLNPVLSICSILQQCISLNSLRLIHHPHPPGFLSTFLSTLPSSLHHLESFSSPRAAVLEDYQRALALPALKELQQWSVVDPNNGLRDMEDARAWCAFVEVCAKRKVDLRMPWPALEE